MYLKNSIKRYLTFIVSLLAQFIFLFLSQEGERIKETKKLKSNNEEEIAVEMEMPMVRIMNQLITVKRDE